MNKNELIAKVAKLTEGEAGEAIEADARQYHEGVAGWRRRPPCRLRDILGVAAQGDGGEEPADRQADQAAGEQAGEVQGGQIIEGGGERLSARPDFLKLIGSARLKRSRRALLP
jgi:hypothetical protein